MGEGSLFYLRLKTLLLFFFVPIPSLYEESSESIVLAKTFLPPPQEKVFPLLFQKFEILIASQQIIQIFSPGAAEDR